MSRCFPYPPPGYTPSRASKEALIESIKLQKELEKTKAQNKQEERRVKRKERKDEKNEIRKPADEKTDLNSKKRRKREEGREDKKRRRKERNEKVDLPNGPIGKNIWENNEQLERSGLTEEHDQPVRLHLPSTSSESTENSSTRKRQTSPVNVIRGHGTIIRIQLSSKKQNLSDISINEQQLCSTSGRTDIPPLGNRQQNFCSSTEKTSDFVLGDFNITDKKQIVSTSGKPEPAAPAKAGSVLDAIEVSKIKKTMHYKNLIENWVPPSLQDAPSSPEDLDWLFCSKDNGLPPERRQKIENDGVFCSSSSSSSSLLQPRAQLLPEFDVYALPFTVPY